MPSTYPSRQPFSTSPLPPSAIGSLSPNANLHLNPGAPTFEVRSPSQSTHSGSFNSVIGPPPRIKTDSRDGTTTPKANGMNGHGYGHSASRSISSASDSGADSLPPLNSSSALRSVTVNHGQQEASESVEFGDEFAPFDLGDEGLGMGTPPSVRDREVSAARSSTSSSSYGGLQDERSRVGDPMEDSPMFRALSDRVSRTESTLEALSAQVAQLNLAVSRLQPSTAPTPSMFSPFDPSPHKISASPFLSTEAQSSSATDSSVANLTQQLSALSASVAQLQRLQQTQNQTNAARTPAQALPAPSLLPPSGPRHAPVSGLGNGTLSGMGGGLRPNMGRSFSSSVLAPGSNNPTPLATASNFPAGGDPKRRSIGLYGASSELKAPLPSPHIGHPGQHPEWPVQSPAGSGMQTPLGGPNGLLITKWEHLNLKVELQRAINKYGIGPPNKIQARALPFMLKGSDIIAQAPPTQERIIAYVIPALQLCLNLPVPAGTYVGPAVLIVTTTVDQATQAHKLIRNIGHPLGIRSALTVGAPGSTNLPEELRTLHQNAVQVLCGTPARINEIMTSRGGLGGGEVRLLILDEVDQLIARNLYEHVTAVVKLLPLPRTRPSGATTPGVHSPGPGLTGVASPYDVGQQSPFNPASQTPFPAPGARPAGAVERQTCLFSNTIPTDVINFSQSINVRDPARVLVRREGGPNAQDSVSSTTPGTNLKHTYYYLALTGSARAEASGQAAQNGPGAIGSGRAGGASAEAAQAREYKLETLANMLDDYPLWQAIIHVGSFSTLEAVVYKLSSRQWETVFLSPDLSTVQKKTVLQQWRTSIHGRGPRFLVVFDMTVKPPDVPWVPLVVNFDLPRSVEGYAHRAAAAAPTNRAQAGVVVSFVQAAGGDVEMLRSTECAFRFKCSEVPNTFRDLF